MKTIGLVGGLTWRSTIEYYRLINEGVENTLAPPFSAKILLYSLNRADFLEKMDAGELEAEKEILSATETLLCAGAEEIVLCANGLHRFARKINESLGIQVIHIAESVSKEIVRSKLNKVGLLGVKKTMNSSFYREILSQHGISLVLPKREHQEEVHRIIYDELAKGIILEESQNYYQMVFQCLKKEGAEGIILGCTEIPLLIEEAGMDLLMFDTVRIHSQEIVSKVCS